LYGLSGLDSILPRAPRLAMVERDMPVASLVPRLCAYPLDAVDDNVLVRLNSNAPDEFEYADDEVEAFES
jgi:hypothetical protein